MSDGQRVLVLDRYPPHLRLFTADGTPLWSGGRAGEGPQEFSDPQVLGTRGSIALVLQRGTRISRWMLDHDSLRFVDAIPLPPEFAPLGIVPGCDSDEWLLYARNDDHFIVEEGEAALPRIDYLHTLTIHEDTAVVPLWSDERDITAALGYGHSATLIGRTGGNVVVWHRSNARQAGRVLRFDCRGQLRSSFEETDLATGADGLAQVPRPYALAWTSGVVALDNAFVVAIHRYFSRRHHGVPENLWKTEVFGFAGSAYAGSIVLDGQWQLMDYHRDAGILLATEEPVPHFVRISPDSLLAFMHATRER